MISDSDGSGKSNREWHCDCHLKHTSQITELEKDVTQLWTFVGDKISVKWLFALIPILLVWLSFQAAIYTGIKNLETEIAVIKIQVQAHTDSLQVNKEVR